MAIWCDGLAREADTTTTATVTAETQSCKRKKQVEGPEVVNKKHIDTHERVQTLVDQLIEKHDIKYTPMPYMGRTDCRGGGGQHVSMDEAPDNNSMFNRADGGTKNKPKDVQSPVAQILTEVLTSALAPRLPTACAQGSRSSPAKLIENCTNNYLNYKL